MVTATLVATVTFTAGFTLPGGYIGSAPDLGMAALIDKMNFKLFILFNSISMCSSVVTIMALIWAQLGDAILTKKAFKLALPLLVTALQSMAMAFVAGVTLVVSDLPWLSHLTRLSPTHLLLSLLLNAFGRWRCVGALEFDDPSKLPDVPCPFGFDVPSSRSSSDETRSAHGSRPRHLAPETSRQLASVPVLRPDRSLQASVRLVFKFHPFSLSFSGGPVLNPYKEKVYLDLRT
ncbi:hypothetical protein YC2023_015898 [Brassica napus]